MQFLKPILQIFPKTSEKTDKIEHIVVCFTVIYYRRRNQAWEIMMIDVNHKVNKRQRFITERPSSKAKFQAGEVTMNGG
jgi:hypothetical protein